jgi:hypothetical protein
VVAAQRLLRLPRQPIVLELGEPLGAAAQQRQRRAQEHRQHRHRRGHPTAQGPSGQDGAPGDGRGAQRLVHRQRRAQVDGAQPEQLERRRHEEAAGGVAERQPGDGRQGDGARQHGLEEALAFHGGEAGDEAEDEVRHVRPV